ncbi:MAG: NlpC/P60 family protein [Pseudomonadota bacterium]
MQAAHSTVDLRSAPSANAPLDTQLLFGEMVLVHAHDEQWAWVESEWDGYQGYVAFKALAEPMEPTHRVCVPRTFQYAAPDLKAQMVDCISLASEVAIVQVHQTKNGPYAELADGSAIYAPHLVPIEQSFPDWIATARELLGTPYLWAGRSGMGADCSAFVQLALRMANIPTLRDSDMQSATLGEALDPDMPLNNLSTGDLVFWRGHVGLISKPGVLLHCNARTMSAVEEPLEEAVERIANLYEQPTGFRRVGA